VAAHFLYAHKYGFGRAFVDIRLKRIATSGWLHKSLSVSFLPDVRRNKLQFICLVCIYIVMYFIIAVFWDLVLCILKQINRLRGDSINSMSTATARALQKHWLSVRRHAVTLRGLHCRKKFTSYVFVDILTLQRQKLASIVFKDSVRTAQ